MLTHSDINVGRTVVIFIDDILSSLFLGIPTVVSGVEEEEEEAESPPNGANSETMTC